MPKSVAPGKTSRPRRDGEAPLEDAADASAAAAPERRRVDPIDPALLRRVVVEDVRPEIDGGRFPIKRVVGERVVVEADIHADGHDTLAAVALSRKAGARHWRESVMEPVGNDRW